jgi:hypothetical protein
MKIQEEHMPLISTYLNVAGYDWDPATCTAALGMEPFRVWYQPQHLIQEDRRRIAWSIGFKRRPFDCIDDAVLKLFETVWPAREQLKAFVQQNAYELSFACNVTIWRERPEYTLGPNSLQMLAWFNAPFTLDIFDHSRSTPTVEDPLS